MSRAVHCISALAIGCTLVLACLPVFADEPPKPESWRGIPLMPGYHSETELGGGKAFLTAVDVPFDTAEAWYRDRMKSDGWTVSVRQSSPTSIIGGGPMVSLDFSRASEKVNVMLVYSIAEKYTMAIHTTLGG